jgi:prevent-host-death family protein
MAIRLERMNATDAKNRFGDVLEKASGNTAVSLMKHGKPAAYVISPALYEVVRRLEKAQTGPLEKLERDFEALIGRMQTSESEAAAKSLMSLEAADLRKALRRTSSRRHA